MFDAKHLRQLSLCLHPLLYFTASYFFGYVFEVSFLLVPLSPVAYLDIPLDWVPGPSLDFLADNSASMSSGCVVISEAEFSLKAKLYITLSLSTLIWFHDDNNQ